LRNQTSTIRAWCQQVNAQVPLLDGMPVSIMYYRPADARIEA
jgi:hypothetical protein